MNEPIRLKPNALLIDPDGTITPLDVEDQLDHAHKMLGQVDVFAAPDGFHVGAVYEWSITEGHPANRLAWLCHGRSMLHGRAIVWRDDQDHLDASFMAMLDLAAERLAAGDDVVSVWLGVAAPFWEARL